MLQCFKDEIEKIKKLSDQKEKFQGPKRKKMTEH